MTDYDDDFRHQAEQQRDVERMAAIAREALARCVGVAITNEEAEAICCLAGLNLPNPKRHTNDTQRKEPQCLAPTK